MKRLLTTLILLLPQLSWAAEKIEPNLLGSSLKMLAGLAFICGLLLLVYAASKKGFGFMPKPKSGAIKVLETRPLGGKKFLCLVSVRGQDLLLGLSNERIECLTQLPPANDFAAELAHQEKEQL